MKYEQLLYIKTGLDSFDDRNYVFKVSKLQIFFCSSYFSSSNYKEKEKDAFYPKCFQFFCIKRKRDGTSLSINTNLIEDGEKEKEKRKCLFV